jgi:hypothetical protein
VQKEFWFGGRMWRGKVLVDASCAPGEYNIDVHAGDPATKPLAVVIARVFESEAELLKNSGSMISLWFGVSPWQVAGCFAVVLLLCFGAVYRISGKRDAALAALGRAEVFRVVQGEDGFEVYFGLGTEHGVQPGMRLTLYDERGVPLGQVTVLQSVPKDSVAHVEQASAEPRTGFLVSRN